jgi:hypothetical protein
MYSQSAFQVTTHVAALVIVLVVLLVADLDRPRRSLIKVPQDSLLDLQTSIQTANAS